MQCAVCSDWKCIFCPCCGHNSVEETFDNAVKKIETKIESLEIIKAALVNAAGKDAAEITCRSLIETGLNDCVVAFNATMKSRS